MHHLIPYRTPDDMGCFERRRKQAQALRHIGNEGLEYKGFQRLLPKVRSQPLQNEHLIWFLAPTYV